VRGGAFHTSAGKTVVALWATTATGEAASATYALASTGAVTQYAWDYSTTNTTTSIPASNGSAMVTLTSAPQFFELP
jgi:hypothetical protein